jgi:HSF-type DNA-binding
MMCDTTGLAPPAASKDAVAKEEEVEEGKPETKRCPDDEDKSKQEDHEDEPEDQKKASTPATTVVIPFRDCSRDPIYKTISPTGGHPTNKSQQHHRVVDGVAAIVMGHFPTILHVLLARAESCSYQDIVSWRPHGRCFVVYDRSLFVRHIMPMHFRQTQFPSFQRQYVNGLSYSLNLRSCLHPNHCITYGFLFILLLQA